MINERSLVENLPDAIVCYDNKCRRIYVNSEWERINGLLSSKVLNKTLQEVPGLIQPIVHEFQKKLEDVIHTGSSTEWECELIGLDGKSYTYFVRATPEKNQFGDINCVLTTARNITKLKEIEMKKLDKQMSSFFKNSLMGMAFVTLQKKCLKVNKKLCDILGYTTKEFQNMTLDDITFYEDLNRDTEQFSKLFKKEIGEYRLEKRFIHKSGSIIFTNFSMSCICDKEVGKIEYVLVIIEDITEPTLVKKELESLNNALENDISQRTFELEKKKKEYKSLAENIPDNIARWDLKSRYIYLNSTHMKTLGVQSVDEVLGKTTQEINPLLTQGNDAIKRIIDNKEESITIRQPLLKENSEYEVHEVKLIAEKNEKGEVISVLGIGRDITKTIRIQEKLIQKEQEFRTLAEHTPDTIARYDKQSKRTYANPAFCKIAGKTKDELLGKTPTFYNDSPTAKEYEKMIQKVIKSGIESDFELFWKDAKGKNIISFIHLVPEYDSKGNIHSVLATGRDITKIKEFEKEIVKQRDFQDTLLNSVAQADLGLHVIEDGKYIYTNNAELTKEYYGELTAQDKPNFLDVVHPNDKEKVALIHQKRLVGEDVPTTYNINLVKRNGEIREHEVSVVMIPNTDPIQSILVTKDITERKNIEKHIEFLAHHDTLTGLPNRILAKDRAEQILARAKRLNKKAALLFVDLDGFKTVNDSLGHSIGDEIIKKTAARLQSCTRESDTISRHGGDEFIVILPEINDSKEAIKKCEKLLTQFKIPFQVAHHTISLSASIGISIYPDHGDSFELLLQNADAAMYKAKEDGKNDYYLFTNQIKHNLLDIFNMQNDLKSAIKNKEFILHFQPQIDIVANKIIGVETLIRWKHPRLGMIPPINFIPTAESTGLIAPIGDWVIMETCKQAAIWNEQGKDILVAVNISAVQFKKGRLLKVIKKALKEYNLDPRYLELELTESILIHDTQNVLQTVKEIKELGVQLSIDDFGTGYSSLAYLKKFAVDKLKIDQSFVKDIVKDKDDAIIVKTIIQMAKSFNLRSIAEGVENKEVLELIKEYGCDEVQGYYFAKPMGAEDFEEYYKKFLLDSV